MRLMGGRIICRDLEERGCDPTKTLARYFLAETDKIKILSVRIANVLTGVRYKCLLCQ